MLIFPSFISLNFDYMGKQRKQSQEPAQEQEQLNLEEAGQKNTKKKRKKNLKKAIQCDQVEEYINSKVCEICLKDNKEHQLMLCDRCDDCYHISCLTPPLNEIPEDQWVCEACQKQIIQLALQKNNQLLPQKQTRCFKCEQVLGRKQTIKGLDKDNKIVEIECKSLIDLVCLYCKHSFHNVCFSLRKNSLNCFSCEVKIRKKGPKSHDQFMKYIEKSIQSVTKSDFVLLEDNPSNDESQTHRYQKLRIPSFMTSWQFIVQYEASLYYAFATKGLTFIDEQIYDRDKKLMELNNPKKDTQGKILRLHPKDQKAYEQFKKNSKKGFVGPFEIKEDRTKGFYLTATDYIQPYTIVSQYVGEVMTSRDALKQLQNDSIFSLLRGARSIESLDIVPQKYGNISRFFAGLNNNLKKNIKKKLENIKSLRFCYKGRVRLLLHTIKPIQAGETLYFDYNGSAFHEYPTDHFVH